MHDIDACDGSQAKREQTPAEAGSARALHSGRRTHVRSTLYCAAAVLAGAADSRRFSADRLAGAQRVLPRGPLTSLVYQPLSQSSDPTLFLRGAGADAPVGKFPDEMCNPFGADHLIATSRWGRVMVEGPSWRVTRRIRCQSHSDRPDTQPENTQWCKGLDLRCGCID